MKKTSTSNVKHLMLTAVASLLGLTANAQYSQTVEQYPDKSYATAIAKFKLTEVANTLNTDTATLANALTTWYATNTADGVTPSGEAMFQCYIGDVLSPSDASGYNGNFNGMWFGKDGSLKAYGSGAVYHAESSWSSANDEFDINLCQYPDSLKGGESLSSKFALTFNGKTATFDVTYSILTPAEVPDPATKLLSEFDSKMTKGGETSVSITRTEIQGYTADTPKIDAKEVAEKLGIELAKFKTMDLSKMIYTTAYDTNNGGIKSDTLTNTSTATSPGFWYRQTIYGQGEEKQGENSPILGAASYGSNDKLFLESFKFDGDSITCNLGQYPGVLAAGDELVAPIYIIYGDKYYLVNYNVKCVAAEVSNISDYTNTGNLDIELEFNQNTGDYGVVYKEIDMTPILEALGTTDASTIEFKVAKDEDAFYPGSTDAGTYGYWMSADGTKTIWKDADSSPLYITYKTSGDPSVIGVGLFAGLHQKAGNSYTSKAYYVVGSKYYTLTFKCNVVEKVDAVTQAEWEVVATKNIAKQVIVSSDSYIADNNQTAFTLTADECKELVGTSEPVLYCDLADSLKVDGKLYAQYGVYPCSPTPGVWLGKDGQGHAWSGSTECPVGICWLQSAANGLAIGDFAVFQVPNINEAGSTYTASLYLVNEETYKMIKLNFNITFVNEIQQAETVGTESLTVKATSDDEPFALDLTKAAEALGVAVEDLLNEENKYFKVVTSSGLYTNENVTLSSGYTFDNDGSYNADGAFGIVYAEEDGWLTFINKDLDEETWKVATSICFEVNGKQYVFNITVLDEASYDDYTTGINDIKTNSDKAGKIYNLQGMEVKNPVKGQIYIQNGKKVIK